MVCKGPTSRCLAWSQRLLVPLGQVECLRKSHPSHQKEGQENTRKSVAETQPHRDGGVNTGKVHEFTKQAGPPRGRKVFPHRTAHFREMTLSRVSRVRKEFVGGNAVPFAHLQQKDVVCSGASCLPLL